MKRRWKLLTMLTVALVPSALSGQDRGSIAGQVVDASTSQPLIGVQVTVTGTTLGTLTNQDGRYLILNVPAGQREVRASRIGYARGVETVTVGAGQTATANFALETSVLELEGVIATATGQSIRRRELGNSVASIETGQLQLASVSTFSQLLQGRVAGATIMQSSGTVGTGSRVRIRGLNSVSLSNAPLLIIDGIRVDNAENSLIYGVGGQTPSRLNDLNPENIESIEILKGPAAAAMYGTAAANGVIQVTTKRGLAGAPRFNVWSEYGTIEQVADFPDNVYAVGTIVGGPGVNVPPGTIDRCDIVRRSIGANPGPGEVGCTGVTDTYRFNPLKNPSTTPFQTGAHRKVGASVSGGGEAATYYVSGDWLFDEGVLPQNYNKRISLQANATGQLGSTLTVGTNIGWVESYLELPQSDNALFGILPMALYGDPRPQAVENSKGFASDPAFFYDWKTFQDVSRFTGAVRGDWRPLEFLQVSGTVGLDRQARADVNRLPQRNAYDIFGPPYAGGFIQHSSISDYQFTSNLAGTVRFNPLGDLVSTTSIGAQYIREAFEEVYAFGSQLTPGIEESLAGATAFFDADEVNVLNSTVSAYVQQQLAWRDRVFLSGALRGDQNTAFGTTIDWIWYPSASASWVISEEPFFPRMNWLNSLRLRGAWGQSGLRPGPTDALQSFVTAVTSFGGRDLAAIVINAVGNPNLKPERSSEIEVGLETSLLSERIGAELTYFNKVSRDALVSRDLPPSLGASRSRFENIGEVKNTGLEALLNLRPVALRDVTWDLTISGSTIKNVLVDLGKDLQGEDIQPIDFGLLGNTQRHQEGYPLGSWFQQPITFDDANGDGRLTPSEVTVADSVEFLGNPFPTREISVSTTVNAFGWVRLSGLLDYKGGHQMMNFTRAFRCTDPLAVCEESYSDTLPLELQAAIIGARFYGTYAGWVEDADFWRLREVALTFTLPARYARYFGSQGLNLTLAGRNLATWTDYTGLDPEVAFNGQSNFISGDHGTLPPNRQFVIRVDANF